MNTQNILHATIVTLIALGGCANEGPGPIDTPPELRQTGVVSDCGGFASMADLFEEPDGGYCDAERLHYEYDAETGTLELRDARILLNCCGDRSVDVELVDGVYVIHEIDLPEGGEEGGRCNCMCVFDYDIAIEDVPAELVQVRLTRNEGDGASTVWEGELDLTSPVGVTVVDDEDVGGWCAEPAPTPSFDGESSDCGGFPMDDEEPTDSDDYCDAEMLRWDYDAESGSLTLTDERVLLNCCGIRDISLELVEGVYVITETDEPEAEGARCDCACVFDFSLLARGIPAGSIQVQLKRQETDVTEEPVLVWEGSLELSLGAGEVEVDTTDVGMWCGE